MSAPGASSEPASLIETAGDAVVVTLETGLIVSWNTGAEALYGYTRDDAVGLSMEALVPDTSRSADAELRRRAMAGEALIGMPVQRRRRDGAVIDVTIDLHQIPTGMQPDPRTPVGDPPPELATLPLDQLLTQMPGIVFTADLDGVVTYSAGEALSAIGLRPGGGIGFNLKDFAGDDNDTMRTQTETLLSGESYIGPFQMGDTMWVVAVKPIYSGSEHVGVVGVALPSADWLSEANTVAIQQARYRALAEHSSDLVAVIDGEGCVSYVSPSVERLLGWRPDEVVGRPADDFVRTDTATCPQVVETLRASADGQAGGISTHNALLRHANGCWRDYEVISSDYLDDPSISGFVINGRDITERRQADLRLRHASLHDSLTDLPNRALLIQEVEELLESAGPDRSGVAVVVIGLDGFKLVNDSLGHEMGDDLLLAVARRLRREVRSTDTVARLGGDTFAVTTTGISDGVEARLLAGHLLAVVSEPFDVVGRRIAVTAGAGVAISSAGEDGTTLVRNADTAMYAAKRIGRGRVELFQPKLRADAARRLSLEQSLGRAAKGNQLRVHFQPIMELAKGADEQTVIGVEALVRWKHPDLGLVSPFDFIPMAEETGHIVEIGAWVLRESCRTLMGWARAAAAPGEPVPAPLRLSVNLSPRQLLEPDLPDLVADVLDDTGFPVDRLTMEVTESVLVDEGPYATTTLRRLREMGVRLSIDDFGTGYSSLVYLRRLNADALKVDRSFVDGLGRDSEADAIVRAVISLASSLGLDLVAEGVETEEQRLQLVELGCGFAQGDLFSRPLPAHAFARWRDDSGGFTLAPGA